MSREPQRIGQLDLLLLAVMARGPLHGYAVIEQLRVRSGGAFEFPEGTVYPALYRLESLGWLRSDERTVAGRARRVYRLTREGRAALAEKESAWRQFVARVDAVLRAEHG